MYEIFTIGGGEYIVNTFNAIASWTGSGGWRGMIRVMMVLGLIYALIVMAFSLNWRALLNWFLAATLLYGVMIVPTVTVKVTDRINPSLAPATISNVPIGLATIASFSSKISDYLTNRAETVFTMPAALKMNNNGFIYGARLYDKTREFKFRDPRVNYNVAQYFKQCVFYDIMLGFKNIDTLANSKNLLNDIGPGSPSRGLIYWSNDDSRDFATCEQVYNRLNGSAIPNATDEELSERAKAIYPNKNSTVAHNSLKNHLGVITGQMHGGSQSAEVIFQQRALTQAFLEARANLSEADGDTFATLRAEAQARNTYSSIAQQAMTWVPLLNIVLTVVFYAMFPVIFPLFLLPSTGVQAVKGYVTGFFYLAAWGPLYVILHMFVMDRYSDSLNAIAPGGMTMATMEAIDNVNVDTATIAGFLMMSIPFIAGGMAKGAMAISSQATSMLAPAQSAAEAAAVERTTGNYSYGNLSYQNLTGNMRQSDQWNTAPNYMGGFGQSTFVSADGTTRKTTADGSNVYRIDGGMSQLPFRANVTQNSVEERNKALTKSQANIQTTMNETAEVVSALQRRGYEMSTGSRNSYGNDSTSGFRNAANTNHALREGGGVSFSTNDGRDISQSIGKDKSKQEQYTSFDLASGSLSVGANTGSNGVASGSSKGKGGKKGASGLNTGAGPNVSYGYDTREGVLYQTGFSENISDKSSFSANSGTNSFSDKTTNLSTDNGTFNQASSFSRNENYNDSRYTDSQLFDRLQSLTNRLTEQQQTSETLSNIFSSREGGGMEMSHDMSQIIAARYHDYANSYEFRGLNAPSLTATNVQPGEIDARSMIANAIIEDYIDEMMQPMRDNNPQFELSPLELDKPSEFTEGDLAASVPHQPTSQNSPSGNSKIESMEDKIKDGIASGSQDIQDAHQRAGHKREQKIIGASTLGQEAEKAYNKKWFYDKK